MKIRMALPAGLITVCLYLFIASPISFGSSVYEEITSQQSLSDQELFVHRVGEIWGSNNVWIPSPSVWVQYEADLGERSAVDFENGTVRVQLLLDVEQDPEGEVVLAHLRQGVRNLIIGDAEDPVEMVVLEEQKKRKVNKSGRYHTHDLALGYKRTASKKNPLLLDQIRMSNGKQVSLDEVEKFAADVVKISSMNHKKILGDDGVERQSVTVEFDLAPNHLEIRARKFYPMVKASSQKYDLDPSLIMGIIHTESKFNPRARSETPAFGLMQLVPKTGAREAYKALYGKSKKPTAKYLYDPKNNIELGVAYFNILRNRYLNPVDNPESRTYCAVAAYNAGTANVGRAFTPHKSIKKAAPVINNLPPNEVYKRLIQGLHIKESRLYTRKVLTRSVLYSTWN